MAPGRAGMGAGWGRKATDLPAPVLWDSEALLGAGRREGGPASEDGEGGFWPCRIVCTPVPFPSPPWPPHPVLIPGPMGGGPLTLWEGTLSLLDSAAEWPKAPQVKE